MPLTDTACRNARCPEGRNFVRLADSGGLYLEVFLPSPRHPKGSKLWRWKYRSAGKEKRLALGSYPAVSLASARQARDDARKTLKAGSDPGDVRKDARLARAISVKHDFESVARAWHEKWRGSKTDRHAAYVMRRLEADAFPAIGRKPVASVDSTHLVAMAQSIEDRGALELSRRVWQTCGLVLEFAITLGLIKRNPARDVRPGSALKSRKKVHYASLEARDVPELLRKIEVYQGSPLTRMAMKLMAFTFVRTTELIAARWDEFDLDAAEWRIPASRMKMRTAHIVPLSIQAIDVLRSLQELRGLSGYVFPGERDHEKPMSNNAILGALKRMGYAGRMTGHGFRSIASTLLHEMDFEHAHIELQLAHMERNQVSAAYNFATYLPQRRKMMQAWADHLDHLRQGAKVIQLRQG